MNIFMLRKLWHESWRVAAMLGVAVFILLASPMVADLFGLPELDTYGHITAFMFAGIAAGHVIRKLLSPYASFSDLLAKASEGNIGAAIGALALALIIAAMILASRPVEAGELPERAKLYIPMLQTELEAHWHGMQMPSVLAGQIEQETCPSLQSKKCWSTRAELKTAREYGFGLGQITVTSRFNVFEEMRLKPGMQGWTWENRYDPAYQLRALVIKDKDHFKTTKNAASFDDQLAFALSAYNGGAGGLSKDRMLCRSTPGCDESRWFGHVALNSYRNKLAVKGYGKSFFEINREYVHNVLNVRRQKYIPAMGA
jgi:hypothetical protein